jgi:hypothetical protein
MKLGIGLLVYVFISLKITLSVRFELGTYTPQMENAMYRLGV